MAEKDPGARLRRAVKENNLFLVKRLVQRTDQRNPDSSHRRYTSLCWAAVLGHEETFEFLLENGHDQDECSRDNENNTILMLLADQKASALSPYSSSISTTGDSMRAAMRMARLYFDYYPKTIHWANIHGKTALHVAALSGNEELVRVVQLLIERGCIYAAKNDEGFMASDYAYSISTRDALQDAARIQYENNKKTRRAMNQPRGGSDLNGHPIASTASPSKIREIRSPVPRHRSGSGTSRTTNTSDSGDESAGLVPTPHSQTSISTSSSPSHHSHFHNNYGMSYSSSSTSNFPGALNPPAHPSSALSQLASRVRERDADAMEKYMRRNRSESSSTDNRSANGSFTSAPSPNGDNLGVFPTSGSSTPRRLRPSISASQLRSHQELPESRTRAGTNPTSSRPQVSNSSSSSSMQNTHQHPGKVVRSPSTSHSLRSKGSLDFEGPGSYTGPPSQYAQFPEPPFPSEDNHTPTVGRRMAFHPISKPSLELLNPGNSSVGHRRGLSATASFRGA
ncbi:Target of rapamycin complex 2 subunit avo2 [Marasmius tenuissimus]|uniref:Target of rapamycin complex 2 subunit avo2 n=1 Tax=Marasmius tenuissimus TaxID=585030 RepID=A0ABR3A1W8_9AGAR